MLFLHGYGESSTIASMSTAALTKALAAAKVDLLPVPDGYHKLKDKSDFNPIPDPDYKEMCLSGDLDAFAWFPLYEGPPREVSEHAARGGHRELPASDFAFRSDPAEMSITVRKLVKDIDAMGGVDAVFGFSQGGELALLLAESAVTLRTKLRLKFIVCTARRNPSHPRAPSSPALSLCARVHACGVCIHVSLSL